MSEYFDQNHKKLNLGDTVIVPTPKITDPWIDPFSGLIKDFFSNGDVLVSNGDGDAFAVSSRRVTFSAPLTDEEVSSLKIGLEQASKGETVSLGNFSAKDKNGHLICLGDSVKVPEPLPGDEHSHAYTGDVVEFLPLNKCSVMDEDGDTWDIECNRVDAAHMAPDTWSFVVVVKNTCPMGEAQEIVESVLKASIEIQLVNIEPETL